MSDVAEPSLHFEFFKVSRAAVSIAVADIERGSLNQQLHELAFLESFELIDSQYAVKLRLRRRDFLCSFPKDL